MRAGEWFKSQREQRSLTMRDLEMACRRIAETLNNPDMRVSDSTISEMEVRDRLPDVYKLAALCEALSLDWYEVLDKWGVWPAYPRIDDPVFIQEHTQPCVTRSRSNTSSIRLPQLREDIDVTVTQELRGIAESWHQVPIALLREIDSREYRYARIGSKDVRMRPLLMPGALVVIRPQSRITGCERIVTGLERPIYFLRLIDDFVCCWCELKESKSLILYREPASPVVDRILRYPDEVVVVGRVVGIYNTLESFRFTSDLAPNT